MKEPAGDVLRVLKEPAGDRDAAFGEYFGLEAFGDDSAEGLTLKEEALRDEGKA